MEVWGGSQLTARGVEFGGLEAWVYSKPYGGAEHGGDVYYASSCGTGRITRLLLADVAGHGEKVAAAAADLRTLMRRFVNRVDQREFVGLLNQQFARMSRAGSYATAVVTTFFSPTRRLTVCNAGHPRPLLYRALTRQWTMLSHSGGAGAKLRNTPLGLIPIAEYEQFDVELDVGDCLLCYTDALLESCDADGGMLGEGGVLRILGLLTDPENRPDEPPRLAARLLDEIRSRYQGNLTDDDVTVMLARANGKDAAFSLAERMRAFFRLAGAVAAALKPGGEPAPLPDFRIANVGGAVIPALGKLWRARSADPGAPGKAV
jgi:serine phosphatase RsbU (regulator of sigma subunit)